jgi:hypothetical protein
MTFITSCTNNYLQIKIQNRILQGVPEMHGKILTTIYWLHVELGKNL